MFEDSLPAHTVCFALVVLLAGIGFGCGETTPVTDELVREAVTDHVRGQGGTLELPDPRSPSSRLLLDLERMHEAVERTPGGRFRAAGDFVGPDGSNVEVHFYVDSIRPGGESEGTGAREEGGVLDTSPGEQPVISRDLFRVDTSVVHAVDGEEVLPESERARLDSLASDTPRDTTME